MCYNFWHLQEFRKTGTSKNLWNDISLVVDFWSAAIRIEYICVTITSQNIWNNIDPAVDLWQVPFRIHGIDFIHFFASQNLIHLLVDLYDSCLSKYTDSYRPSCWCVTSSVQDRIYSLIGFLDFLFDLHDNNPLKEIVDLKWLPRWLYMISL